MQELINLIAVFFANVSWSTLIITVLTSGVVSAIVTGKFNLSVKDREYRNDYYKKVLEKRMNAYEALEVVVVSLKSAVLDEDNRQYHICLSDEKSLGVTIQHMLIAFSRSLWMSEDVANKFNEINDVLLRFPMENDENIIEHAKNRHDEIALWRDNVELIMAQDMLSLHKVEKFLNEKRRSPKGSRPFSMENK